MIAYKLFQVKRSKLYPIYVDHKFEHYPKGYTITRADDCGPFACFESINKARNFSTLFRLNWAISSYVHKVKIKKSKKKFLKIGDSRIGKKTDSFPDGTIFADEFEILERVK